MAKQWIRKATLIINVNGAVLDVSQLHFSFETEARTLQTPKTLQLRLFNPAPNTIKRIVEEGSQIFLSAGYEGSFGSIFQGTIIQVRSGRENGTDTYLDISASDGDRVYNNSFVNATVAAGSTAIGRLKTIASSGKLTLNQIPHEQDGDTKLPRGKVFFGLARDHLRPLAATIGADWSITNGQVDVIAQNAYRQGDVVLLTHKTGMIGVPVQTLEGIAIKALLNPGIEQGMRVKIDNASVQQYQADIGYGGDKFNQYTPAINADGLYKVLYCRHSGDTRGQEWYTDLVGYSGDHITNSAQQNYMPTATIY